MKALDMFGREYGWTMTDLDRLTIEQANFLIRIIENYHAKAGRAAKGF